MSKEPDLPSDSDEDDEDYVPDGVEEAVSEAESEGEAESSGPDDENNENEQKLKRKKGKKGKQNQRKKKRKEEVSNSANIDAEDGDEAEKKELTEEEQKKRADSLWADFMKDTNTTYKAKTPKSPQKTQEKPVPIKPQTEEKIKVTKIFEFAGEEVKVEKQVPINSAEARFTLSSNESTNSQTKNTPGRTAPRPGGLGGISSVLGQIGKKNKISTLEKSKLDWDNFKKQENLEEEIQTFNRGKSGYLERQDFLERADVRQFEIEKQLRTVSRRSNR